MSKLGFHFFSLPHATLSAINKPDWCLTESRKRDRMVISLCLVQFSPLKQLYGANQARLSLSQATNFRMGRTYIVSYRDLHHSGECIVLRTQWNLGFPVPGEIFNFTWPVCCFPGATFTYPACIICLCLKKAKQQPDRKGQPGWKFAWPSDLFSREKFFSFCIFD